MKTLLAIAVLLLAGCSVEVKPIHIVRAQEYCKDHGGIQMFKPRTFFGLIDADQVYIVDCIDGSWANVAKETK